MPIGTLTQKIADQSKSPISTPPTIAPLPKPIPAAAAQTPIAVVRRSCGKASIRIESVSGAISAAPTPCSARKAIRCGSSGASAQAAENAVKTARPAR